MKSLLRTYFAVWSVMMIGAALELVFVPQLVGGTIAWGTAAGWQREIAFWNVGMLLLITTVLQQRDRVTTRRAALVLCLLNVLFGTNHLAAFLSRHDAWGNGVGVLVNYGCLLLGISALWSDQTRKKPMNPGTDHPRQTR